MTDDRPGYESLVEAAIEREKDVIGADEAIEYADAIDGLDVDDDGTVLALEGDGEAVLGELIDAYVDASGDVAAFLIARRLENVDHGGLDLPPALERHM